MSSTVQRVLTNVAAIIGQLRHAVGICSGQRGYNQKRQISDGANRLFLSFSYLISSTVVVGQIPVVKQTPERQWIPDVFVQLFCGVIMRTWIEVETNNEPKTEQLPRTRQVPA